MPPESTLLRRPQLLLQRELQALPVVHPPSSAAAPRLCPGTPFASQKFHCWAVPGNGPSTTGPPLPACLVPRKGTISALKLWIQPCRLGGWREKQAGMRGRGGEGGVLLWKHLAQLFLVFRDLYVLVNRAPNYLAILQGILKSNLDLRFSPKLHLCKK